MAHLAADPTSGPRRARRARGSPAVAAPATAPRPLDLAVVSTWFGLLVGLSEVGLTLLLKPLHDPTPGLFRMNRNLLWAIPTLNLALFRSCGLLLAVRARVHPERAARVGGWLVCFLASLTLLLTIRKLYLYAATILAAGLATRVAPRLGWGRGARFRRLVGRTGPLLALAATGLIGATIGREALAERRALAALPPAAPGAPNVLLIVLDTVRADHLSAYGYDRDTTPNLARLARSGVRFDAARSTASWTLPSHASMFTGRWPHELSAGQEGPLDATYPTLAEFLAARGYATAGFAANTIYCGAEAGLARGFAHYEDHDRSLMGLVRCTALGRRLAEKAEPWARKLAGQGPPKAFPTAAAIGRAFLDWLPARGDRPFFAFLNVFDAHHPYVLPPGEHRRFGLRPGGRKDEKLLLEWPNVDKAQLPPRDVAMARDAYDDCLAYLDAQLGRLFDELDRRALFANTLVIVTADHGESFGEHGVFCHAGSLYRPEVHVPLIVSGPVGVPVGAAIDRPVSLRDLPRTVADLLGRAAAAPFPGRSLAEAWRNPAAPPDPVLSEVDGPAHFNANQDRSPAFRGALQALVASGRVYLRSGDGREELYDAADVEEARDLSHSDAARADLERLRATLDHLRRPSGR